MGLWTWIILQNHELQFTFLFQLLAYFNISYIFFAPCSNQFSPKILDVGATLLMRKKIYFEACPWVHS